MPSSGFSGITGWCQPTWIQILFMRFGPFLNDFSWSPFICFFSNTFFFLLVKEKTPAPTTWPFSSTHTPTCFGLMVDRRVHTVTLFKQYLSSSSVVRQHSAVKVNGEMQEIIWFCRYSQTYLMASITTFLKKCWGKGWKIVVLASGNWFCDTWKVSSKVTLWPRGPRGWTVHVES